jgi:hypothetical protein
VLEPDTRLVQIETNEDNTIQEYPLSEALKLNGFFGGGVILSMRQIK